MQKTTTVMKETNFDVNKWRDIPCSWIWKIDIVKMLVVPNLIYGVYTIAIKIPASYFVDVIKVTITFIGKTKT